MWWQYQQELTAGDMNMLEQAFCQENNQLSGQQPIFSLGEEAAKHFFIPFKRKHRSQVHCYSI